MRRVRVYNFLFFFLNCVNMKEKLKSSFDVETETKTCISTQLFIIQSSKSLEYCTICLIVFTILISSCTCTLFSSGMNRERERERERDRRANTNLDMMDDHHHDGFHSSGILLGHSDSEHHLINQGICEPIKIGLCMELGYNQTTMPNLVGHDGQGDADALLQTFAPLIQYGCSPNLKLFLCAAHVPMCTDKVPQPIGPCRSLCESVRRKCEPVLTEFGFIWPPPLECEKFHPENNHQHMCIPDPSADFLPNSGGFSGFSSSGSDFSSSRSSSSLNPGGNSRIHPSSKVIPGNFKITQGLPPTQVIPRKYSPPSNLPSEPPGFQFPVVGPSFPILKPTPHHISIESRKPDMKMNTTPTLQNQCIGPRKIWSKGFCWIKCGSILSTTTLTNPNDPISTNLFHPSQRVFARNYALLWAILSLSAAFIALILSVCSPKLSTAERPILYIALCQVLFSIGVIIGSTGSVSCFMDKGTGMELLAVGGMVPSSCAVVFLLTYFFGMAATLWWVILCLSWLLALNRDLCLSLQQKEWSMFHLGSWGIASLLTSTALIHKKVDADELTGLCGVGFQNMDALTYYNMIPLNIALTLGLLFLLLGLVQRLFPGWKQIIFSLGQTRKTKNGVNGIGHCNCERERELEQPSSRNNGYTPVLVLPPSGEINNICSEHCHHPHNTHHTCSSNHVRNCNNLNTNNGGSSGLTFSSNGVQRLRALENSKAVWMRVGIFALVHSLPIACQVGTMAYELSSRENWENGQERPNLQIFLLRLNMNLIAGLTTGVWVLSTYSWKSLSSLIQKFNCCLHRRTKSQQNSEDKTHFRVESLVTTTMTSDPLLPPPQQVTNSIQSPISNNHRNNNVLSSFQPGCHLSQSQPQQSRENFAGILPRHHNYPLPRLPIPPTKTSPRSSGNTNIEQPRTDAWRRGETIV